MSADIPRRTLAELAIRYSLEPQLADVFVEGAFDQDIMRELLRDSPDSNRVAYAISSVDIAPELVVAHSLTDGNKQRVIVLARELASKIEGGKYKCLVDRDLDHWYAPLETTPRLEWTKYCAIELYFFCEAVIQDVLITLAKAKIKDWSIFFESFSDVLRDLYRMRVADRDLEWAMTWISYEKCLSRSGSRVVFAADDYLTRLLMANKRAKERQLFVDQMDVQRARIVGDPRLCIRGHDFVGLIRWSINEFGGLKEFSTETAIERCFVLLSRQMEELKEIVQ